MRERGVDAQEAAAGPRLVDALDGVLEDAAVARFGLDQRGGAPRDAHFEFLARGAQGLVGALAQFEFGEAALGAQPPVEFVHDQRGHLFQDEHVVRPECARLGVDDAQRAEPVASPGRQRCARVKTYERLAEHVPESLETLVERRIGNDQRAILQDRVGADRLVARGLGVAVAVTGFVPLAVAVYQRDEDGRNLEDPRGQLGDAIQRGFGRRVQHPVTRQLFQAVFFVEGQGSRHRTFLQSSSGASEGMGPVSGLGGLENRPHPPRGIGDSLRAGNVATA